MVKLRKKSTIKLEDINKIKTKLQMVKDHGAIVGFILHAGKDQYSKGFCDFFSEYLICQEAAISVKDNKLNFESPKGKVVYSCHLSDEKSKALAIIFSDQKKQKKVIEFDEPDSGFEVRLNKILKNPI